MNNILLVIIVVIAVVSASTIVGASLSQWVLRRNTDLVESLFIGLTAISSLLSLVYNFTEIPLSYALAAILLIWLPISSVHIKGRYKEFLYETDIKWLAQVLLSGTVIAVLYLLPTLGNIRQVSDEGGLLLAHIDLYTHASVVSQIAQQAQIGNTQLLLEAAPIPFYHYGIYAIPGVLANWTNWSPLGLLIYGVFPLGMLSLWALLNGLVARLMGTRDWRVHTISLIVLLAGDASRSLFNQNALFDLPYLLAASPGVIYGLCIVLLSVDSIIRDSKVRIPPVILFAFLLLGFRALYIPLYLAFCFFAFFALSDMGRAKQILAIATAIVLATLAGKYLSTPLEQFHSFMMTFNKGAASLIGPSTEQSRVLLAIDIIRATIGGTLLLIVAASIILTSFHQHRIKNSLSLRLLLALIAAYYCSLQLAIVLGNGDITELMQRPFIVLNVVSAALALTMIYQAKYADYFVRSIGVLLLVYALSLGREFGFPRNHSWHQLSYKIDVGDNVIQIAHWLSQQTRHRSYVVFPVNTRSYSIYPEAIITALSGASAFVSRPGFHAGDNSQGGSDFLDKISYIDRVTSCSGEGMNVKNIVFVSKKPIPCLKQLIAFGQYRIYE